MENRRTKTAQFSFYLILFRDSKKNLDDERKFATTLTKIQTKGLRLQRWLFVLLIFLLMSLIIINSYNTNQFPIMRFGTIENVQSKENVQEEENYMEVKPIYHAPIGNNGFLVHNKGCRIPAMDPFDPAIKRFLVKEKPYTCEYGNSTPLVESNTTALFINPLAWNEYDNQSDSISCCWRPFWRVENEDNRITYDKECFPFQDSCTVNTEFVKVECSRNDKVIYKDYHVFLPRKPWVEERCEQALKMGVTIKDRLNVLVLGLDSVSRLNFHRQMPKTVKALQSLGAVEMLGYTKVADNTYPNLVPVLTGLDQDELHDMCWQNTDKTFDECPFIWKKYSAVGYRTIFGEDAYGMTTFNYLKPGFREQPTDYYLRPFAIGSENDIGNTHKWNAKLCIGTRKTFEGLLHYVRKAETEFSSQLHFTFIWQASLTHDYFTYPQLGDDSYSDFVEYLSREGMLNNTAFIVMSDHGIRWGDFRQTYQGRIEESLPFVFIVLPKWWRETYSLAWNNLRRNSHSLTSPFDLHETLEDLINPYILRESSLKKRIGVHAASPVARGISWFLPVPKHRTCDMANISNHWCMCHISNSISLNDTNLQNSVSFLIDELNTMLSDYPLCATLKLKEIKDAKVWQTNSTNSKTTTTTLMDYTVTVQTTPGDAIFEATIRYRADDNSHKVVGSVSRLNTYGKQSACVDEFNMRLYCYCL